MQNAPECPYLRCQAIASLNLDKPAVSPDTDGETCNFESIGNSAGSSEVWSTDTFETDPACAELRTEEISDDIHHRASSCDSFVMMLLQRVAMNCATVLSRSSA